MTSPGSTLLSQSALANLAKEVDAIVANTRAIASKLEMQMTTELMPRFKGKAAVAFAQVHTAVQAQCGEIMANTEQVSTQVRNTNAVHAANTEEHAAVIGGVARILNT